MTPSWLQIAEGELGVTEIPGPEHNPRILEYLATCDNIGKWAKGRDETPNCSAFVNWALIQAGYIGTNNALARSWLSWGIEEVDPKLGAICVIRRRETGADAATGSRRGYHVGFVAEGLYQRGMLKLLGANQRDQVKYSNYPLDRYEIKGYRWPIERIST